MHSFPSRPLPDFKCIRRALFSDISLDNHLIFFYLFRDALVCGLEALEIEPGSTILIPAYMCNSTIEPLRNLGYDIIFFDVKEDLSFDLNMIESLISGSNVEAILSVHYFGFPTNIQDLVYLCKKYNVKVVEDCAHSFLTKIHGQSVGLFGDIAIFSMRKTLAIPDGGALKLNVGIPLSPQVIEKKMQWLKEVLYLGSRILESIICFIGFPNLYSTRVEKLKKVIRNIRPSQHDNDGFTSRALPIKSSFQLKAYLHDIDYKAHITERRKHNYNLLVLEAEKLGFKSLIPQLPDGCVPQFFILIDEKKQLAPWLRRYGIGAVTWPGPELPQEVANRQVDFPVTNSLNDHLVMLPIHQSLNKDDMLSMIDLLKKWVRV
jgi:dTDP-4-amino-4,6-dideoxygalactose transaminase